MLRCRCFMMLYAMSSLLRLYRHFFWCLFTYRPGCREVQAQDGCGRGPANPWRKRVAKWEKSWFNNG